MWRSSLWRNAKKKKKRRKKSWEPFKPNGLLFTINWYAWKCECGQDATINNRWLEYSAIGRNWNGIHLNIDIQLDQRAHNAKYCAFCIAFDYRFISSTEFDEIRSLSSIECLNTFLRTFSPINGRSQTLQANYLAATFNAWIQCEIRRLFSDGKMIFHPQSSLSRCNRIATRTRNKTT